MDTREKLFSDFAPVTAEQWKAKAIEDLKGADFDKKLVWKTDDGFPVQPFYTGEDLERNETLKSQYQFFARSQRQWVQYAEIPVADTAAANSLAADMVQAGATGLLFNMADPEVADFDVLLDGIDPGKLHISFSTPRPSVALVKDYFRFLAQSGVRPDAIRGFYSADVLESWITTGAEPDFDTLAAILQETLTAPGFKTLVVQSHAFVNAGASTTQELAFTLNKLTDYFEQLSKRGIAEETLAANLVLHTATGGDYFFEIGKLRALRILLDSVLELYGCFGTQVPFVASGSLWSKSFYDPNVNMLRNTTEAMSAVLGGCDALLVQPHDFSYAQPTKFSRRIALNVSNLLKEEAYLDKVADPAAGSYYLESLTGTLSGQALALFQEIEGLGGFIWAFRGGAIQGKIRAVRSKKEGEIASRRRVYVGTNKYPNGQEKTVLAEAGAKEARHGDLHLLVPQRATRCFEELRSRTLNHFNATGFMPRVYLACFGNLAMRKARATFASEFFGTAGFEIMGEYFFTEVQRAAEESARSNASIVVICSSDADYETSALAFAEAFRALAKDKTLVLAGYPESIVEQLKAAGVDAFIHIKSNAIDVLTDFQNKLLTGGGVQS